MSALQAFTDSGLQAFVGSSLQAREGEQDSGLPCHSCDPGIPATLTITLAGLSGDFAVYNGAHSVPHVPGAGFPPEVDCLWRKFIGGTGQLILDFILATENWKVFVFPPEANCSKTWTGQIFTTDEKKCDPTLETYTEQTCVDVGCDDTDSCEDSAGATCVVS